MIPRSKKIHTYMGAGSMLMGAERDRKSLKETLKEADELLKSGPNMGGMGYGLCIVKKDGSQLFVCTKG